MDIYIPDREAAERMGLLAALSRQNLPGIRIGSSLTASAEEIGRDLGDAGVVCVALGEVSASAIESAPRLQLIIKCGIGVDNIDVEAAAKRGIPVLRTAGVNSDGPAEWVIAMALHHFRRITEMDSAVRTGSWQKTRERLTGRIPSLAGRTLSIAGFGAIGRRVATLGAAHGMRVLVHDPYSRADPSPQEDVTRVTRDVLLREADVLSLNMVLTKETYHFIGARELTSMKETAILCNVARGPVVDERALVDGLRRGQIAFAALDVFESEPLPQTSQLREFENVILSPHLAGCTDVGYREIGERAAELVADFFDGVRIPENCVVVGSGQLNAS